MRWIIQPPSVATLFLVGAACLSSDTVSADTLSKSASTPVEIYTNPRTLNVDSFDPVLGNLQKVTITFSPLIWVTILGQGEGSFDGWAATVSGNVNLFQNGSAVVGGNFFFNPGGVTTRANETISVELGPSAISVAPVVVTENLGRFISPNGFSAQLIPVFHEEFFWSSGGSYGFVNRVGGEVKIDYEYLPVPEPAPAVLAGIGLVSLFLRARRGSDCRAS